MDKLLPAFALLALASLSLAGTCYLTFEYEPATETVRQIEAEVVEAEYPEQIHGGNVELGVYDSGGEFFLTTVRVPLFSSPSYTDENMPAERGLRQLEKVEFSALLPCGDGAERVIVRDTNGSEMASFDLPVPQETPEPAETPEPPSPGCAGAILLFSLIGVGWLYAKRS